MLTRHTSCGHSFDKRYVKAVARYSDCTVSIYSRRRSSILKDVTRAKKGSRRAISKETYPP